MILFSFWKKWHHKLYTYTRWIKMSNDIDASSIKSHRSSTNIKHRSIAIELEINKCAQISISTLEKNRISIIKCNITYFSLIIFIFIFKLWVIASITNFTCNSQPKKGRNNDTSEKRFFCFNLLLCILFYKY